MWQIFYTIGWIPAVFIMLWGFKEMWVEYIHNRWAGAQKKILLAIDIPRGNTQSPRAVENMFAYLAGAHGTINLVENYWEGKIQLSFSFEIVSIDGYTQFIIRTPEVFRHLVETAIYSQYPDAEITEVNDYIEGMPKKFPDEEYDMWGTEFIQAKNEAYPIKLYTEFEHQMGPVETFYRDPMAALMDLCSSLRKGEQLWFQIIVKPIDMNEWTKIGDKEAAKILKEKPAEAKGILPGIEKGFFGFFSVLSDMMGSMFGYAPAEKQKEEKKDESLKMMQLKPKERKQVEAVHAKIGKIGFHCKFRFVYIAKKDVMNKPKVVNGFVGFMKQFAAMDLNNLKPDMKKTATSVHYFFKNYRLNGRKKRVIRNYIARDGGKGRKMGIFTTDELATVWHFPVESVVKAPMIQKAPGRKAEPPSSLPIDIEPASEAVFEPRFREEVLGQKPKQMQEEKIKEEEKGSPPDNLPFI